MAASPRDICRRSHLLSGAAPASPSYGRADNTWHRAVDRISAHTRARWRLFVAGATLPTVYKRPAFGGLSGSSAIPVRWCPSFRL